MVQKSNNIYSCRQNEYIVADKPIYHSLKMYVKLLVSYINKKFIRSLETTIILLFILFLKFYF